MVFYKSNTKTTLLPHRVNDDKRIPYWLLVGDAALHRGQQVHLSPLVLNPVTRQRKHVFDFDISIVLLLN